MKPTRQAISILAAAIALGVGSAAIADTSRGWQYSPPKGYAVEQADDHVALTKRDGDRFCSLSLFGPRRAEHAAGQEAAIDWNGFIENTFASVAVTGRGSFQTSRGMEVTVTRAVVKDRAGTRFGAIHYGLAPHGLFGSAILLASSPGWLQRCEPAAKKFVDALSVDWSAPGLSDPEARKETLTGRWASNHSESVRLPGGHRLTGIARTEYSFAVDGTYVYESKLVGEPETVRTIVERGTYATVGPELTLTPTKATVTLVVRGHARPSAKLPLHKRTYVWDKTYQVDTNQWSLEIGTGRSMLVYSSVDTEGFPNM